MGSATRDSKRRAKASRRKRNGQRKAGRRKAPRRSHPTLTTILGVISDGIAIITTAVKALVGAQERDGKLNAAEAGNEIVTLEHGVSRLRFGYETLELAIREAVDFALAEERKPSKRR
jgi:hypothetical protein